MDLNTFYLLPVPQSFAVGLWWDFQLLVEERKVYFTWCGSLELSCRHQRPHEFRIHSSEHGAEELQKGSQLAVGPPRSSLLFPYPLVDETCSLSRARCRTVICSLDSSRPYLYSYLLDPQPESQCAVTDQLQGRIQGQRWPLRLPEACPLPGGHQLL